MKIKSTIVPQTPRQKKQEILNGLHASVDEMNKHLVGKKQFKTAQQLLDE